MALNLVVITPTGEIMSRRLELSLLLPMCQNRSFLEGTPTDLGDGYPFDTSVCSSMAPDRDGIAVIDRQRRWAGVCSPRFHGFFNCVSGGDFSGVFNLFSKTDLNPQYPQINQPNVGQKDNPWSPRKRLLTAWQEGCIHRLQRLTPTENKDVYTLDLVSLDDLGITTREDLLAHLDDQMDMWGQDGTFSSCVLFEPPGWHIHWFENTPTGLTAMANELLDRGLVFDADTETWEAEGVPLMQMKAQRAESALTHVLSGSTHPVARPKTRM